MSSQFSNKTRKNAASPSSLAAASLLLFSSWTFKDEAVIKVWPFCPVSYILLHQEGEEELSSGEGVGGWGGGGGVCRPDREPAPDRDPHRPRPNKECFSLRGWAGPLCAVITRRFWGRTLQRGPLGDDWVWNSLKRAWKADKTCSSCSALLLLLRPAPLAASCSSFWLDTHRLGLDHVNTD